MGLLWDKTQFYFILFLTPVIFAFQMIFLFPKLVKIIEAGPIQQYVHICLATFLLVNICGNMILGAAVEFNNIKEVLSGDKIYCDYCKKWRPRSCMHCKKCNACIMRREHHCGFLANCIGQYNKRYYVLFLGHVTLSMIYATLYNYSLITAQRPEDFGPLIYIARIINPAVWFLIPGPIGKKDLYTVYITLNFGIALWSGYLFYVHMSTSAMGVTLYENKYKPELKNLKRWRQNLLAVFGERWYLAILWPFCSSPLPRNEKVE